jgi:histidine triad (HIT) family protein
MTTVFEKIIKGELPAEKVYESESVLAIQDINPVAPVHLLIIPKKAIKSFQDIGPEDLSLIQEVTQVAQELAVKFNVADNYRFLTNNGAEAGQTVFHLHFHLIGGRSLGSMA